MKNIVAVIVVFFLLLSIVRISFKAGQRFQPTPEVVVPSTPLATATTTQAATPQTLPKPAPKAESQQITPPSRPSAATSGSGTLLAGCPLFPASNPWNQDISSLPLHPNSEIYKASIGLGKKLHPDFGGSGEYGIPYTIVSLSQPKVPITYTAYGDESDPGPFPIPQNAAMEGGSDRHVLVLQEGSCLLYELYAAVKNADGGWSADSGALWNLATGALRPFGWTSADAAGLPILLGLVKYDEAHTNTITHAIRFTAPRTQKGAILPATHHAGSNDSSLPPMGLRMRLKADYDISNLSGEARAIAIALKKYGMILADNGSSWYITGAADTRWNDDNLNQLKSIPGSAFEAVYTGEIQK